MKVFSQTVNQWICLIDAPYNACSSIVQLLYSMAGKTMLHQNVSIFTIIKPLKCATLFIGNYAPIRIFFIVVSRASGFKATNEMLYLTRISIWKWANWLEESCVFQIFSLVSLCFTQFFKSKHWTSGQGCSWVKCRKIFPTNKGIFNRSSSKYWLQFQRLHQWIVRNYQLGCLA